VHGFFVLAERILGVVAKMTEKEGAGKVLVVDDEEDMRIYVSVVLETNGYEAVVARNGAEGLEKAREFIPDLIILDVMMPDIEDGIYTYRNLREDPDLKKTPVIMLSAIAGKTFLHSIRMLSAKDGITIPDPDGYMEKPPDADELGELIEKVLKQ
jgi:CheY-like chemotaxis protein